MLIEELIRLGRPLVEGGLAADEVLKIVTDVADPRAKNFFRNVFVAELPDDDSGEPVVQRVQGVPGIGRRGACLPRRAP
jgi:hypothetical protein